MTYLYNLKKIQKYNKSIKLLQNIENNAQIADASAT